MKSSLFEPSFLQFFPKLISYNQYSIANDWFCYTESFLKIALRWELFVSQERLALLEFSVSPSRDPRGSRRPVGATRLPCAISPSTFFSALLSSRPLFLSLPRSSHAFRYTRRPAWTPAIRLTVEEMRTRGEARIDPRDFSDLAALWFITRTVITMKNALHRASLNYSLFCKSYWLFFDKQAKLQFSLLESIVYKIIIKSQKVKKKFENII